MIAVVALNYQHYLSYTKNIKNPRPYYYITGPDQLLGRKLLRVVLYGQYYQRDDWDAINKQIKHMERAGDIIDGVLQV